MFQDGVRMLQGLSLLWDSDEFDAHLLHHHGKANVVVFVWHGSSP